MQDIKTFSNVPHKRYNPLTGEWILVSPHRTQRPWKGKQESQVKEERPQYKQDCYLCPGNKRAMVKLILNMIRIMFLLMTSPLCFLILRLTSLITVIY